MKRSALLVGLLWACDRGEGSVPVWARPWPADLDALVKESLDDARAAVEQGQPGALLGFASTCDANGLAELAAESYALCLERGGDELGPEPRRLPYLLAAALERSQASEQALAAFERARSAAPDYAPAHWRAGGLLLELGRAAEARQAFERALALEPGGVPQALGLARVELFEGAPAAALERLEPLAARHPRERYVHGLLARARRALGDEAGAAAALRAEQRAGETTWNDPWSAVVRERATGVPVALQRANERLLAGDARGALAILEPVHQRMPDNLSVLQFLAKALLDAGELDRAASVIRAGRERHPGQYRLELHAGLLAMERRNYPRARQELRSALALNPAYGPTLAALGEVEMRLGELAEAKATFARALEQGEDDLRTRVLAAQVDLQLGDLEGALARLEEARAAFPDSVVPFAHLAEVHARRGDALQARAALAQAERIDQSFPYLARVRGLVETMGVDER